MHHLTPNHWIVPQGIEPPPPDGNGQWVPRDDLSLDGFFYDHLCLHDDQPIGVRYWLMDEGAFEHHVVYQQFLHDRRFKFYRPYAYVDMVFDEQHADALQAGVLRVETVQHFCGDGVIESDGRYGIVFDLR